MGEALIKAAKEWGRKQGCTEFVSDTEWHNEISAAAHRALGFIETDRIICFKKTVKEREAAMIITDVVRIEKLAEKKSDENWEYRAFLKGSSLSSKRIDAVVHRLHAQLAAQIDCTACANCCKTILPILDQEDIDNFARGLGLSVENFTEEYLIEAETGLTFKGTPCPFLVDNKCSNYEHRPKDCACYPHLHKPGFLRRTIGVMSNCSTCPIIFNVIEGLKVELPQS